mmetsp:Transcript_17304/g.32771  ORF Transcript_17304/g.32771 Transcript_17304/m.32771 type:complete len:483 (+) Transcript_17304:100-1548(+)|eukprot:CAMPEP_0176486870 /NCGR_PEP_ID=MMETSP0200_2-20121128/5806_1 /TAXON_ID=947934 /ORGANISM="Chaetoceros sp., Strain GSL56" /LENGTH=482 /DNA_ID=CAMNT_0017883615 /DNA_START=93 /DNA_END=1541 /DNA_ORIENTATION=+
MANSPRPNQFRDDNSGLHHLVEAATALTQLVSSVSHFNTKEKSNVFADGDVRRLVRFRQTQLATFDLATSNVVPIAPNGIVPSPPVDAKNTKKTTQTSSCSREIFPQRLMRLLSDFTISDVITWLPHGKSFVILQPEFLAENILPTYFPETTTGTNKSKGNSCKYPSFTRKLNRWGFRQVTRGPDSGAFHHKLFCRDQPDLCLQMICQRSRRRKDTERNDSVSIVSRSTSHSSESNQRSLNDSESVSSIVNSPSNASAPSILDHSQVLSNGVYRTTSPAFSAHGNTAIVSNTASPTPRTQVSPQPNPDMHSRTQDVNSFSQQSMSCLDNSNSSMTSALLQKHLANTGVTAITPGNLQLNHIINTCSSPAFSQLQQQTHQTMNIRQLIKDSIRSTAPSTPVSSMPGLALNNKFLHVLPTCTSNIAAKASRVNIDATNASTVDASVKSVISAISSTQGKGLSEEEIRIANAKSLLYNAYLKALG